MLPESIEPFVKQAVAYALIADDHLLGVKEGQDPLDQASAGENHVGPFGQKVLRLSGCDSSRFGVRRVD